MNTSTDPVAIVFMAGHLYPPQMTTQSFPPRYWEVTSR